MQVRIYASPKICKSKNMQVQIYTSSEYIEVQIYASPEYMQVQMYASPEHMQSQIYASPNICTSKNICKSQKCLQVLKSDFFIFGSLCPKDMPNGCRYIKSGVPMEPFFDV